MQYDGVSPARGASSVMHPLAESNLRVRSWHIASFCCAAEFCRDQGMAGIDKAVLIKLDP
jgi:hypothetical protein